MFKYNYYTHFQENPLLLRHDTAPNSKIAILPLGDDVSGQVLVVHRHGELSLLKPSGETNYFEVSLTKIKMAHPHRLREVRHAVYDRQREALFLSVLLKHNHQSALCYVPFCTSAKGPLKADPIVIEKRLNGRIFNGLFLDRENQRLFVCDNNPDGPGDISVWAIEGLPGSGGTIKLQLDFTIDFKSRHHCPPWFCSLLQLEPQNITSISPIKCVKPEEHCCEKQSKDEAEAMDYSVLAVSTCGHGQSVEFYSIKGSTFENLPDLALRKGDQAKVGPHLTFWPMELHFDPSGRHLLVADFSSRCVRIYHASFGKYNTRKYPITFAWKSNRYKDFVALLAPVVNPTKQRPAILFSNWNSVHIGKFE